MQARAIARAKVIGWDEGMYIRCEATSILDARPLKLKKGKMQRGKKKEARRFVAFNLSNLELSIGRPAAATVGLRAARAIRTLAVSIAVN